MRKKQQADLVAGTDPDCDRVGIAVKNESRGICVLLTGNETGMLLLNYVCSRRMAWGKCRPQIGAGEKPL